MSLLSCNRLTSERRRRKKKKKKTKTKMKTNHCLTLLSSCLPLKLLTSDLLIDFSVRSPRLLSVRKKSSSLNACLFLECICQRHFLESPFIGASRQPRLLLLSRWWVSVQWGGSLLFASHSQHARALAWCTHLLQSPAARLLLFPDGLMKTMSFRFTKHRN